MIGNDGMVYDGLRDCGAVGTYYTYNSGVAMAWLTELYMLSEDKVYLDKARAIADAAMKNMVSEQGILVEVGEPKDLGNDGIQFKGIFIRHLGFLYSVSGDERYRDFIIRNATSVIENGYSSKDRCFGSFWTGPFDKVGSKGHSSAWEAVIEAYGLSR